MPKGKRKSVRSSKKTGTSKPRVAKATVIPEGVPNKSWTTRELRAYIRARTMDVNKRIQSFGENISDAYGKLVKKLQKNAGLKRPKEGVVGLGLSYKHKDELLKQARGLEGFIKFDKESSIAVSEHDKKLKQSYDTFMGKYYDMDRDFTFENYKKMWEDFEEIGDDIRKIQYMSFAENYSRAVTSGHKVDLKAVYDRASKRRDALQKKNKVVTNTDFADMMMDELKKDINKGKI